MTFYKKYRTDINGASADLLFFRRNNLYSRPEDRANTLNAYDSIVRFYSALEGSNLFADMGIRDCLALKLAGSILDRLDSADCRAVEGCSLDGDFYLSLADEVSESSIYSGDRDVLVIYLKQTVHLLREKGLVDNIAGYVKPVYPGMPLSRLYRELVQSFWNVVDWKGIFPSSPGAAEMIYDKRDMFIDILLQYHTEVKADDLAGDFLELSDISEKDDRFMISFIEFYLIAWLENLGIINCRFSGDDRYISVDDYGKKIITTCF